MFRLFKRRCRYARECKLYSVKSYTCNEGQGGGYCGKYRELQNSSN